MLRENPVARLSGSAHGSAGMTFDTLGCAGQSLMSRQHGRSACRLPPAWRACSTVLAPEPDVTLKKTQLLLPLAIANLIVYAVAIAVIERF